MALVSPQDGDGSDERQRGSTTDSDLSFGKLLDLDSPDILHARTLLVDLSIRGWRLDLGGTSACRNHLSTGLIYESRHSPSRGLRRAVGGVV